VTEMEELLLLSKAMSDLNRLKIVTLIQREQKLCVCEISDTLGLSQPLVSRHLKQLKEAKVVESRKEGKWMIYAIYAEPSALLERYLQELRADEKGLAALTVCATRR